MSGTEWTFWAFAIMGTLFFILRVGAMIVGGFGAEVHDGLDHADMGPGSADAHHSGALEASEGAFKLLTVNSFTGFFMMFGWMGLAAHKQFGLGPFASFLIALGSGFAAMIASAYLFKAFGKLTSRGDTFAVAETVGLNASAYTRIAPGGRGQIQVSLNGRTRFVDAVSEDNSQIESFTDVVVVRVVDPHTVSVKPRS